MSVIVSYNEDRYYFLKLLKLLFSEKLIAIDIAESSRDGEVLNYNEILNNFNIYSLILSILAPSFLNLPSMFS